MQYKDFYTHLIEQKDDKTEYDQRSKFIQSYIEKMIDNAPGSNRTEKLTHVWQHNNAKMEKLLNGMTALNKMSIFGKSYNQPIQSAKSKFNADEYYIRFGDFPKNGKSKNYATGEMEIGISAYPAKWNISKNKWEIIEEQLEEFGALYSLTYDISEGNGRPVYLIHGQVLLDDLGSDGEPMLDINNIKIIKKLEPYEFFSNELGEDWYL